MRQLKWMMILAVAVGMLASPALAYERSTVTIYAGYSLLNDTELEETLTKGFVGDIAYNVSDNLAIPAEFSWHSKSIDVSGFGVADISYKSYMAGFRLGGSIYTQFLAGGATLDGSVLGISADASTKFAIQPGIGLELPLSEKIALRVGGDWRMIFVGEDGDKNVQQWRGHAGLVIGFGGYY